jgi:hypothetical protein
MHLIFFGALCSLSSQIVYAVDESDGAEAGGDCFIQMHSSRQASTSVSTLSEEPMTEDTDLAKLDESQEELLRVLKEENTELKKTIQKLKNAPRLQNLEEKVGVDAEATSVQPQSSFHKVVGKDGALLLTLKRMPNRAAFASQELAKAGITTTEFLATDNQEPPGTLSQGCGKVSDPSACGEGGCINSAEQAIALSHQRALQAALERNEEWTAIFEDDAVPVVPNGVDWDAEFGKAWKRLPKTAKVVRLGWCQAWYHQAMYKEPTSAEGGVFQWMQFPNGNLLSVQGSTTPVGGCTHAYMVHKSIIPSMLSIFPCCCAVDCCMEYGYFAKQDASSLANLIAIGGDQYIDDHGGNDQWGPNALKFRGVIMQATAELGHTHERTFDFLSKQD